MTDPGSVSYSVKELIAMLERTLSEQMGQIVARLDGIERKLDDKASNNSVEMLARRTALVEERISSLELRMAGATAVSAFQRWIVGTVGVSTLGAIATLVWLASGGH